METLLPLQTFCQHAGMHVCSQCNSITFSENVNSDSLCDSRYRYNHIENPAPYISALNSEIARVEAIAERLREQRRPLHSALNARTPIGSLPSELMRNIMLLACQRPIQNDSGILMYDEKPSVSPLTLGAICSLWREIAWSTKEIWSVMDLPVSVKRHEAQIELLKQWLLRAENVDVIVSIERTSDITESSTEIITPLALVTEALAAYSDRWSGFHTLLPSINVVATLPVVKYHLRALESLTLRSSSWSEFGFQLEMFSVAPLLREVSLEGISLGEIVLPWNQFTTFRSTRFFVDECMELLRRAKSMTHCTLISMLPGFREEAGNLYNLGENTLYCAQLHMLHVTAYGNHALLLFFERLILPSLSELSITLVPYYGFPLGSIDMLLHRSRCRLTKLSLQDLTITLDDILVNSLKDIPTLKQLILSIHVGSLSTVFMHALQTSQFLPQLETFIYEGSMKFSGEDLLAALKWRWYRTEEAQDNDSGTEASNIIGRREVNRAQLTTVTMVSGSNVPFTEEIEQELILLIKDGMQLNMQFDGEIPGSEC
ncbi:hypothetical protein BDQ12DRAFT_683783 [Crucibulum laeve]|uniref:F-box domain-containing protein n=1 Tax=Crucibulum laeve TaxID=68775 RepID=A0A5C3M168_9AGAR|nr:hypothetical protein BDQ12DRAFT_683783 [Crucibulum laeve]